MMIRVAIAILLTAVAPLIAMAEDRAGDFDFYVLALAWSPSYCARTGSTDTTQCGVERHGFIVHGLWPQYETGYPEYCRSQLSSRVPRATLENIIDIMPSTKLIQHQWKKHGICTDLEQSTYFDLLRRAFAKVSIPENYVALELDVTRDPEAVEAAFVAANPGLQTGGIAVTCRDHQLADVRICLTKDLEFTKCSEVDRRACRAPRIEVPGIQ